MRFVYNGEKRQEFFWALGLQTIVLVTEMFGFQIDI